MRSISARRAASSETSWAIPAEPKALRDLGGVEGSPLSIDHGDGAALPRARLLQSRRRLTAQRQIEEFAPVVDRSLVVGRLDGARIGRIAPGQATLGIPPPGRHGRRLERKAQRAQFAFRLREGPVQLRQLKTIPGNVANPHDRAAGHWLTDHFEMTPTTADRGHGECLAPFEEPLRSLFDQSRRLGLQPLGGVKTARSQRRVGDNAQIAVDRRLRVRAIPGDQNLRLASQNHAGPIELRGRPREFGFQFVHLTDPGPSA